MLCINYTALGCRVKSPSELAMELVLFCVGVVILMALLSRSKDRDKED